MKRSLLFLCLALFILFVIQPNLHANTQVPESRIPEYSDQIKTSEDASRQKCTSNAVIVIDPGKGGSETGYDPEGHISEKDIAMQLAVNIGDSLSRAGYQVLYTRWYDDMPSYESEEEGEQARLQFAIDNQADYLISLRFNTGKSLEKGFSIFTQPNNEKLDLLADALAARIQSTNYTVFQGLDMDHYSNFTVLSDKSMPSVILWMGYLSNAEDYAKITDTQFQTRLASAVTNAFLESVD